MERGRQTHAVPPSINVPSAIRPRLCRLLCSRFFTLFTSATPSAPELQTSFNATRPGQPGNYKRGCPISSPERERESRSGSISEQHYPSLKINDGLGTQALTLTQHSV